MQQDLIEIYRSERRLWYVKSHDYHDKQRKQIAYKRLLARFKEMSLLQLRKHYLLPTPVDLCKYTVQECDNYCVRNYTCASLTCTSKRYRFFTSFKSLAQSLQLCKLCRPHTQLGMLLQVHFCMYYCFFFLADKEQKPRDSFQGFKIALLETQFDF